MSPSSPSAALHVVGDAYHLGSEPFRILSGAIHYFRVVPEQWDDRLAKLKACGLNTVETYVCWNLHEPEPGLFDFSGRLDLVAFIEKAAALGLKVIVRPGPYICAEWDFGGLPAWLLRDPQMRVRCSYAPFLAAVDRFFGELLPRIAPLQSTRGGPVIAVQIENEYGAYGNDGAYLAHLRDATRRLGIESFLFTSDHGVYLDVLPELFRTANFGARVAENFAALRRSQPTGPLTCMEFWAGWFDQYGQERPSRDPEELASVLDEMLALGASVNFYMFHGGTNFGFLSGANCDEKGFDPRPTSYDYGALLSEAGDLTPKYKACRKVLAQHGHGSGEGTFARSPRLATERFSPSASAPLFEVLPRLGKGVSSPTPVPMEDLGQNHGFILYRTRLHEGGENRSLWLRGVRDRAWVFIDGKPVGVIGRDDAVPILSIGAAKGATLDILVENMGRTNFGPWMHDRKGILDGVLLDRKYLFGWTIHPLPLDPLPELSFRPADGAAWSAGPCFHEASLAIDDPQDTFLNLSAWAKGSVFLNGFNLGRYWNRGPHQSLFVPKPLLRQGENRLVLFEVEKAGAWLRFDEEPTFAI
ncbi:beta-galactosidase [Verrucomicrobium sp. GAS474]|uniref:glycoside hydrolase family 35 protein n=1 Tax=Verrucomicrobium sp. GAS474 TaxID=1882831 RepID=UPI00087B172D|nr:beta-galactosidase family protein [Verrucomicrobium sp. GAS474]SDU11711.1 beta-galactosidase [Verrucomicrobium sp. GAS474]